MWRPGTYRGTGLPPSVKLTAPGGALRGQAEIASMLVPAAQRTGAQLPAAVHRARPNRRQPRRGVSLPRSGRRPEAARDAQAAAGRLQRLVSWRPLRAPRALERKPPRDPDGARSELRLASGDQREPSLRRARRDGECLPSLATKRWPGPYEPADSEGPTGCPKRRWVARERPAFRTQLLGGAPLRREDPVLLLPTTAAPANGAAAHLPGRPRPAVRRLDTPQHYHEPVAPKCGPVRCSRLLAGAPSAPHARTPGAMQAAEHYRFVLSEDVEQCVGEAP
jgi:hypothetical protein